MGFDSCGMKRQSVCGSTVDQCHRASLQLSGCLHGCALRQVLGPSASGLVVEAAEVTPCTWLSAQRKDALAMADKLSLRMQQNCLLETIPAPWRGGLADLVIFSEALHVFLFGVPLFSCNGPEREQEPGVLLGAGLKIIRGSTM